MMKKLNSSKGITLIALVITMIVLLILAGVTISMLSGENGILKQVTKAKTKTEKATNIEQRELDTMEMKMDFNEMNSEYMIVYGCLANIKERTKVGELKLPTGYEIADIENENIVSADKIVTTGMTVRKNGEEKGRTVIWGDINGDGVCNLSDRNSLLKYIEYSSDYDIKGLYYKKVAANLNGDEELNGLDAYLMGMKELGELKEFTPTVINQPEILKRNYAKMTEYINNLTENCPYKFEYNEEEDTYILKGIEEGTKVGEVKDYLPDVIIRKKPVGEEVLTEVVTNSHKVYMHFTYEYEFKYIDEQTGEEILGNEEFVCSPRFAIEID